MSVIRRLFSSFAAMARLRGVQGQVDLTGGDPFLHPAFFEIVAFARSLGLDVRLKGNPHLIDYTVANRLGAIGVVDYRFSIDGLPNTHDSIRGRGNFQLTMRAMEIVKSVGSILRVHATISRANRHELVGIPNLLMQEGFLIDDFSWSRYWSTANVTLVPDGDLTREMCSEWIEYCGLIFRHRDFYATLDDRQMRPRINADLRSTFCFRC